MCAFMELSGFWENEFAFPYHWELLRVEVLHGPWSHHGVVYQFQILRIRFWNTDPAPSVCVPVITSVSYFVHICYTLCSWNLFKVLPPQHGWIVKFISHAVVAKLGIYYVVNLLKFEVLLYFCLLFLEDFITPNSL